MERQSLILEGAPVAEPILEIRLLGDMRLSPLIGAALLLLAALWAVNPAALPL